MPKVSIVHVVGTRPNFPKVAPVWRALNKLFTQTVIHSGQHYDAAMSKEMIDDTGCHIDVNLCGLSREEAKTELGHILSADGDLVMVYGDCNTAYDAALVALQCRVEVAHVEAGLRCGDDRMVEERNRIHVDQMADILYAPSIDAVYNLGCERAVFDRIQFVGNVMADTLRWVKTRERYTSVDRRRFGLVTMHRPENVDDQDFMERFMTELGGLHYPIVFPKHPRVTLGYVPSNVKVVGPLRYREFLAQLHDCKFVITDSGGLQEEATLTYTPCLTMRPSTERPITITEGTNELTTIETLKQQVNVILSGKWKVGRIPLYWDGRAAERIACHLQKYLSS